MFAAIMTNQRKVGSGFTLVEQLLVLALIAAVLAFGGVRMMKIFRSNSLELSAKNLQTVLRYLQIKSIEEGAVYELSLAENSRAITVKRQSDAGDFIPVKSSWLKGVEVGETLTLEFERDRRLLFFPDGSCSKNRLVIREVSGERRILEMKNRIGTVETTRA